MKALAALPLLAALSACATPPPTWPPHPGDPVTFSCADGSTLTAVFTQDSATVTTRQGTFTLPQQIMGSGIRYSDGMRTFVGKGKEMRWEFARMAPLVCTTP
jgi:membrane-bound inhibitor of C-type lysozyme